MMFAVDSLVRLFLVASVSGLLGFVSYAFIPPLTPHTFFGNVGVATTSSAGEWDNQRNHIATPDQVRAIYMTACVAASKKWREQLLSLADETEINAIVIDVKDYTGTISIPGDVAVLPGIAGTGCKVPDMASFLDKLHQRGVYAIARIAVFQDPFYARIHPELAIKKDSDKNLIWKDRKGLPFIDAGATPYWDYIVAVGRRAHEIGFDELNFDYIRFPTDGNMKDIYFPWSHATVTADRSMGKAKVVRGFFEHLRSSFSTTTGPKLSADLFGMTTTNYDDLSIGQVLEFAAPNFDYIAPMVYPSHYPSGFEGYEDVNKYPYEIVKYSMDAAVSRLVAASTSPLKLRPWLQDNDYPVPYTAAMVRAQIQATYDAGLDSWMLWDPANLYTRAALLGPDAERKNQAYLPGQLSTTTIR